MRMQHSNIQHPTSREAPNVPANLWDVSMFPSFAKCPGVRAVLCQVLLLVICGFIIIAAALSSSYAAAPFITTMAGSAGTGSTNGTGPAALFSNPQAVATDSAGNIYIADTGNNIIRVVTPGGTSSTFAGSPGLAGSAD